MNKFVKLAIVPVAVATVSPVTVGFRSRLDGRGRSVHVCPLAKRIRPASQPPPTLGDDGKYRDDHGEHPA